LPGYGVLLALELVKLGFIGTGKMGAALLEGVLAAGVCRAPEVRVHDRATAAAEALAARTGVGLAPDNLAVAAGSDVIVLCVKPDVARAAVAEAAPALSGKLLVSIAAGVTIATLQEAAGADCRLVRVMPNTPVMVGRGASAYAAGANVTAEDTACVEKIFAATGRVWAVPENLLDAVTGLSGSGPAYLYLVIEALTEGGERAGLPRELAAGLAVQTVAGAAAMVADTGQSPADLRSMVTSPGGTTLAGLAVLEKADLRGIFIEAVAAATQRARELGGEHERA
jgi:pyrroline-5-carboxylate reductase